MGAIGRWIDERCHEEPEVMQRVLRRKFGPLGIFFADFANDRCGCLVGSWLLERGGSVEKPRCETRDHNIGCLVYALTMHRVAVESTGCFRHGTTTLPDRPESLIIRLIKQRIRAALSRATQVHHEEEALTCHS